MNISRNKLREKAMVILYQIEIYNERHISFELDKIIKENIDLENDFVNEIVSGVTTHYDELNLLANKYMENWTIDRIDKTGASILRMAIYELKYTKTPEIVVINEAVELAKKYSDENVRKMINATLDKIIKE